MKVTLTQVVQKYPLDGGAVHAFVQLRLPTGAEVQLEVTDEQLTEILRASVKAQPSLETGDRVLVDGEPLTVGEVEFADGGFAEVQEDETAPATEPKLVEWAKLPEDVLPSSMKALMVQLGAAPVMPLEDLSRLVDEISERMAAQEELDQKQQGVLAPKPPAQPRPVAQTPPDRSVGKLQMSPIPRRRTVPKDDAGNPIVAQAPRAQHVTDEEDGVAQL